MSSIERLIALAGPRAKQRVSLGARTTYRVGGSVRALITLSSVDDALELWPVMRDCDLPVVMVGNGSNLLVADGRHNLIACRLEGELAEVVWRNVGARVAVAAGGGADLPVTARRLARDGVVGFSWAVGVPGTFGGAAVMNAGGHGGQMSDHVVMVSVLGDEGLINRPARNCDFGYRHSSLGGHLVVAVLMHLQRGSRETAEAELSEIVAWRRANQPGGRNGGSVFRNPPNDSAGRLIEACGLKGLRLGTAEVSPKHANFIQVDEGGSANDVYALMQLVRRRVMAECGVELQLENHLIGFGDW
jgi:UDP-N-acetylmuramate dehydrogenase